MNSFYEYEYKRAIKRIEEAKINRSNKIDLSKLNLKDIPNELRDLSDLYDINLSSNRLTSLPDWFANFTNLTFLDVSWNQINYFPDCFINFSKIVSLDISYNQISRLPDWFTNFTNLVCLNISHNNITSIPDWISSLINLVYFNTGYNEISRLPIHIANLNKLESIIVDDCPLIEPPKEIVSLGSKAILNYFESINGGSVKVYEAKLMIVGEPGAGKTTFRQKIINPNNLMPKESESTRGIDIDKWEYTTEDNTYTINLWDFGGQEILHSTHQFFMSERALYVLLADSRKDNTDYIDWLHKIELFAGDSPIIIVHNEKDDRVRLIDMTQISKRFPGLPEPIRCNLAKTKLGTDREIDYINLINRIKFEIRHLEVIGQEFPKAWIELRQQLDRKYNDNNLNYIESVEYFTLCNKSKINKDSALTLARYLHAIGAILYFDSDPVLKHIVIINPEWGTDAVYKVIEDATVQNNMGKFYDSDLKRIWADPIYKDKQHELLQLMMNFKICYKAPNDSYILPQLLPFQPEDKDYNWNTDNNLYFEYKYPDYYLKSIMIRFIVEMNESIESQKTVWRNGVVLKKDCNRAEIIANEKNRTIHIRVCGATRRDFLTKIRNKFDDIHGDYEKLKVEKKVPCNCPECMLSDTPALFEINILHKYKEKNISEIRCINNPENEVSICNLLDDFPQTIKREQRFDMGKKINHFYGDTYYYDHSEHNDIDANNSVVGDATQSKVKIRPRVKTTTTNNNPEIKSRKKNWWQKLHLAYKIIVPILVIGSITILVLSTLGVIDISQTAKDVLKLIGRID